MAKCKVTSSCSLEIMQVLVSTQRDPSLGINAASVEQHVTHGLLTTVSPLQKALS